MSKLINQLFLTFPPLQFDSSVSVVLYFLPPPLFGKQKKITICPCKNAPAPLSNTDKSRIS